MNSLGRDIEKGEYVMVSYGNKMPPRRYKVVSGYGMDHEKPGTTIWGYFADKPTIMVGPLDAAVVIDVEATNAMGGDKNANEE